MSSAPKFPRAQLSRRGLLGAGSTALASLACRSVAAGSPPTARRSEFGMLQEDERETSIRRGRIRQSVMGWCYRPMEAVELAKHCREIGIPAIEGISSEHYPEVQKLGLKVSLVGSHGFQEGPTDRANHEMCIQKLNEGIDIAAAVGCANVITFTGMRVQGMTDKTAEKNCLECWQRVIEHAEQKEINLCLEHLNSRDDSHPMKGHPGYFGDDIERCLDLIRQMNSPRMKLLFDIYHVQIMHGDVIRHIRNCHRWIAHYHTAGVPGRVELDETQELFYPAIMRAILETGYDGYVAQEFIPTWDDPIAALRHAATVCDV